MVRILKDARIDGAHPIITQQSSARFDTVRNPDFTVIADAINVDDDVVFNALVDQSAIDQVVLVQDERESDRM